MKHRKKRKTRKCKLKLGKTLAEIAENAERFGQAKAWFYLLAENAENAEGFGQAKAWFYLLAENADFTIHVQLL